MMAADYRHIGGRENRLGRHYSRFSPFLPAPALASQSLALRKLCDAGSNRRRRANFVLAGLVPATHAFFAPKRRRRGYADQVRARRFWVLAGFGGYVGADAPWQAAKGRSLYRRSATAFQ